MDECKPLEGGEPGQQPRKLITWVKLKTLRAISLAVQAAPALADLPHTEGRAHTRPDSAQRKHILWDTLGACICPSLLDRGARVDVTKTA